MILQGSTHSHWLPQIQTQFDSGKLYFCPGHPFWIAWNIWIKCTWNTKVIMENLLILGKSHITSSTPRNYTIDLHGTLDVIEDQCQCPPPPFFHYQSKESQDAYMVQIWWLIHYKLPCGQVEFPRILSYHADKPNFQEFWVKMVKMTKV